MKRFTVHETRNYGDFNFFDDNRDRKYSKKLEKSIREFGQITPIVVTKDKYIIDGQHRLMVLRNLNYPVHYIVNSFSKDEMVVEVNTT